MLKHLLLAVGCLIGALQISFAQVPDSCHPNTFLKHLGEQGVVENHSALCAAPDGNLYLAGLKGTSTAISKMTPDGKFLWTRSFLLPSYEPVFIAEIIVDSEGMIVGSGHRSRGWTQGFAFRYDPEANKMLWAYEFVTPLPVVNGGILEKTPGGNFLLYQNVFVNAQAKRPEILELDRATGQIVPGFTYQYSLQSYDHVFTSLAILDGALYAGGYAVGLFNARRFLLIKIDATTGQVLRGEAGHQSWVQPSYFSGADMILDDTSVVTLYHGSETTYDINDGSGGPVPLYLQKNALSGEVLWTRKYMVSTTPKEVVAVPDGYVILGGNTDRYLLKTDKQGNLLTAKRLDNPSAVNNDNGEQQNQMVLLGGQLFVADVATNSATDQYTTLLKTDLNLNIEFDCSSYQPWQAADSAVVAYMTNYPIFALNGTTTQQAVVVSPAPDLVTVRESCPFCPETPDSCKPTTFLRIYGEEDKYENMSALCATPDGNLYLAGQKGDGMAIAKMTPDGNFLWARTTAAPQGGIVVAEIIVDSEGMIVGSGHTDIFTGVKGVAFRYNPATNQVIWAHKFDSNQATDGGILEKSPGGNFLLYQNPKIPGLGVRTGEVLELDRATGQIVPAFSKRYALQSNQNFNSIVQHGNALYATGFTESVQNFSVSRRMVLTKLDAGTGNVVWSRTGLTDWPQASYFSAADILVDDTSLVILYHGIETSNTISGSGKIVPLYLQKTTLDGQVLWVKKFVFPAQYQVLPRDLVAVPDGYIILSGSANRHLLKTDKDGNLVVSKILDSSNYFYPSGLDEQNNQIERIGSHLFFGMFTARYGQFGHYTTVLKTDLNLGMDFDCGLEPFPVDDLTVLNPLNFPAQQAVTASPATQQPLAMAFAPGQMVLLENCPFCANPVCADKPDITFKIESIGCDSAAFATYRLCNTGKQPYSGPLNVGVYDTNPLTGAATLLDLFSFQIDNLQPDSCRSSTLNNLAYWGNYSNVYTLAGIESGQSTPVDLAGFPYNGIAECDYANNLDSIAINPNLCLPDSCAPKTFLKMYGEVIKQDNIAALRAAPDGNIYVAGGKADGYAIGKMTPTGDLLWLRSFTGTIQDRTFVTEIIVDSEGMIVGCGRRGSNSNETIAFRYNPVTNQILWERRLSANNPTEGGILEKKPGGNFLIYHSIQTSPLGFKSAEMLELNRTTGQIVPAFAKRYAQQVNQVFAGMVLHEDALYTTGFIDSLLPFNLTARRMTLTKMDANTGNVLWTRLGLTPWSQASHFRGIDLIVDDNSLIVLSHGIETSNTISGPGKVIPVYLHRTTLDGEVLWAQKYLLTEVPRELVAVPDGFVIFCGNNKRHFLKTDKEGNLLFAKTLNTPDYFSSGEDWQKNQIERVGSHLYITDLSAKANSTGQFTTVLKTDLNLGLEFDCGLEFVTVSDTAMTNPLLFATTQTVTASPATTQTATLTNMPGSITVHQACPFCPKQLCTDKPDLGPDRILCAGQTTTLDAGSGFVSYTWSNGQATETVPVNTTGIYIVEVTDACGQTLRDTVAVTVLPQPVPTTLTIQFYPGDTIILAGTAYTQSDTVVQTLLTADGCDSVVTTILQLVVTKVNLSCPGNLTVPLPANQSSVNLTYPLPTATTDCPDPDIALTLLQGLPVGGAFPLGNTLVCYEAANHCGIRDTCCFTVTIQPAADEEACDVKIPPGSCIRFEVLNIQLDALGRPRYRMRLTNTCASPLKFVYFQLPNGMTAKAPLEGATYTAPSGNTYLVRNPNAAPFHSIRFKPLSGNLNNGESDIFEYTLPKQAQQAFILVSAKLTDNTTFDAHLNTFSCPVLPYVASVHGGSDIARSGGRTQPDFSVLVRPNPTTGLLFVNLQGIEESVLVSVLNAQGQLVQEGRFAVENDGISLRLPEGLANGLYYLWVQPLGSGQRVATRFVLER